MSYYICYANEDRKKAIELQKELSGLGAEAIMIDRGDTTLLIDPIDNIRQAIVDCDDFIVIHSGYTNVSTLSQIEITYAVNKEKDILVIKTDKNVISNSIGFCLKRTPIVTTDMKEAVKSIIKVKGALYNDLRK
ncbi:MAG: toll/interleukin-1 receptor domain-containing protein [Clostridia bacterium]|nr:toll/interleukin-1 receptor domain-containing protein [Clostridia bacterium]